MRNRTVSPRMGATDLLLILTLSVIWGGSFFFAKITVAEVPPLTLVFLRVDIAAALHLVVRAAGLSMAVAGRSGAPSSAWACSTMSFHSA